MIFEWSGLALLGAFLAMALCPGNDLPGPSEIHQGLGPYGPGCSYATEGKVFHITQCLVCELEWCCYNLSKSPAWGSTCIISSISCVCLPQQYIVHVQHDSSRWCIHKTHHADKLSSKTSTASQGEIYTRVSSRVPFLYLKKTKKQKKNKR